MAQAGGELPGIAIQLPDGKIFWAHSFSSGQFGRSLGFRRLLPDGQTDTSFGTGGGTIFSIGASTELGSIQSLPGGKLLVTGSTTANQNAPNRDLLVFRINSDGALDTGFGNNGFVIKDLPETGSSDISNDTATSILSLPNGQLLIGGVSTRTPMSSNQGTRSLFLLRLNSDGSFDDTFGQNGILQEPIGAYMGVSYDADATSLARYRDGSFIVSFGVNTHSNDGFGAQGYIAKYLENGTPDKGFGETGRFTCTYGYPYFLNLCGNPLTILPDGNIMARMPFALTRITSSGVLDPSFANSGIRIFNGFVGDFFIQNGLKILVTLVDYTPRTPPATHSRQIGQVTRIYSNGMVDLHFGIMGKTRIDYQAPPGSGLLNDSDIYVGDILPINERSVLIASIYTNTSTSGVILLTKVDISK
ncbi:MAG: hypothetical protein ABI999_00565 [Acidobacteriota bacterium]